MGLKALLKEAFLFEPPSDAVIPSSGTKAVVNFPEDRRPKASNRVRLLSAQGGENTRLGSSDSSRKKAYTSYLGAVNIGSVWKAVNVISNAFASSTLHVLNDADEDVDIKQELPGFYKLLKQPNPETDSYTFLEHMAMDLELTGNFVVALDSWNAKGEPTEMFRLRPDMVRIVRMASGALRYGYDLVPGTFGQEGETIWYSAEEILHWKYANSKDPLWGYGTVEAGELLLSCDRSMNEFKLAYFSRGAILEGILECEGDMDDTEYDRLLTKWRALREGAGKNQIKTAILWQGAHYEPIQEPLGSVPIVELARLSRNDVLELFNVPPAKVGDLQGINYNNSREADAYFWSEKMVPMLRRVEPGWDKLLAYFGDGYRARYPQKEIVDWKTRSETAFALAQTGAFTRNDIRVAAGYDPLDQDDPLGDVFLGSSRQALFPGEYDEPLDYLPMTPGRLLGVEEPAVRAQHEAIAQGQPAPGQPFTPGNSQGATAADGPKPANGSTPPSQQNRRARATPPASRTRSGVGRSSTGRKSLPAYPEGLLSAEAKRRLAQAEKDAIEEQEPGQQGHVPRLNPYLVVDAEMQEQHDDGAP